MKNSKTRIAMRCLAMTALFLTTCCAKSIAANESNNTDGKSIVVLYENDVHCGIDGYTKIAGLRNAINQSDTAQCIIVSSGDYIQGGEWGALSKGQYIIDVMDAVGYSAATIGNHEFDYSGQQMLDMLNASNIPVTCVNFSKHDSTEQYFKPYIMTEVSGRKLAFVGIVTPTTLDTEYYAFKDKEGNILYDLYPDSIFQLTQSAVDKARAAGADYVFLLSHLGEDINGSSSIEVINATSGIDLVLDGHTHSVIPDSSTVNKSGKTVHFTQTGTKFAYIGKMTISRNGELHTELIPAASITYTDSCVDTVCDSIKALVRSETNEKIGTSNHVLSIYDANGKRIVRKAETAIGNFVADAFRYCMGTEISIVNAGSIRDDMPVGDITFGHLLDIDPYFNDLQAKEMTGRELRQLLQRSYSMLPNEDGNFAQVSGLKVTIDLTSGKPLLTDVQVEDTLTQQYHPLDDDTTYTIASNNYVFGFFDVPDTCKDVTPIVIKDTDALKKYFVERMKGNMGDRYTTTEGRITIKAQ